MNFKWIPAALTVFELLVACSSVEKPPEATVVDARDGRIYKTVQVGNQVWLAENLNYGVPVNDCDQQNNGIVEKTFYENDSTKGAIYGGLYTWNEAMNWQKTAGNQGICPDGWHIPTREDWQELVRATGGDSAGQQLKASKTDSVAWDGNNRSGFTAIPAGVAYQNCFGRQGHWAVFWSSTAEDSAYAWFAQLDGFWYPAPPKYKKLYLGNYYLKANAFCIRCVKDRE